METTLISVVVPVYNIEDYLERCVNSICAQTYQNLEILLVLYRLNYRPRKKLQTMLQLLVRQR
jgi:GT2 family glycosyltransferase